MINNKQTKNTNKNILMYEPPSLASELVRAKLVKGELIREGDWVGSPDDLEILKILATQGNVLGNVLCNIVSGIPISVDTIKINLKENES